MTEEAANEPTMEEIFEGTTEDSAPQEPETAEEEAQDPEQASEPEPEKPQKDGVQERINQLTAKYRAEERRRLELEEKLKETQRPPPAEEPQIPTLEAFDYDESAYQRAMIEYNRQLIAFEVQNRTQSIEEQLRQERLREAQNAKAQTFAQKVQAANIPDYQEALQNLVNYAPLSNDLVEVVQGDPNGPQLVHYLGTHLDVADRIANINNPAIAAMELGKISAGIKKPPTQTKAPKPIEPLKGTGRKSKALEDMTMDEIWNAD